MTDKEIQEQAEKFCSRYGDEAGFAKVVWDACAKWMQEQDKWISVEDEPNPADGYYWVLIDGKVQNATVNEKEYAKILKQEGFWQYGDCQMDERVYPTHYMLFTPPSPPKTK